MSADAGSNKPVDDKPMWRVEHPPMWKNVLWLTVWLVGVPFAMLLFVIASGGWK